MGKSIKGVELFAVGKWNGRTFTGADLDGIAASFDALGLSGRVPLKFGHSGKDTRHDGSPALGWVERVYRKGEKLLGDLTDVHDTVYGAIREALYKFVSIELLKDVPADTRTIPYVLDAVALLGAEQPAVGILKDLQGLAMTRGTGLQHASRMAFKREFVSTKLEDTAMSVTKEDFEELKLSFTKLQAQTKATEAALEDEKKARAKDAIDRKRSDIKAVFERAIESERIQPADRERFARVFKLDDDKAIDNLTVADAEEFIKAVPVPENFSRKSKAGNGGNVFNGTVAEFVSAAAEKLAVERGFKANDHAALEESTKLLFRKDKALATKYFDTPDAAYTEEA